MPTLIALTESTRGDVPAEVTHLVEVFPEVGEAFVGYCLSHDLGWWFENDVDADGPETEEFLQQYRYGRPAEPHELPTRAEASPSVGRDELVGVLVDALERIASEYPSVAGPIDCPPAPHACPKCEIAHVLRAALAAAGKGE